MTPNFLIVDLFCGAGGTTTGFEMAERDGQKIAKVIACVNHDPKAIESHWKNHPDVKHFEEDIRTLDLTELIAVVKFQRSLYKTAYTTSVNEPIGALPTNPKANVISFLFNPSHGGHSTSVEAPCPVIVARQDKAPLYLIRAFMQENGVVDIKMRMLRVPELLKIQGFPDWYELAGNQSQQKKFIGNSVHPLVVKYWIEAIDNKLIYLNNKKKAA